MPAGLSRCTLCGSPLDMPGRRWSRNCGGDCLACMAEAGDPECVAAMTGWRPIETVPKDGTELLLYRPAWAYNVLTGAWSKDHEQWWVDGALSNPAHFTHWMPLPPEPRGSL